MNHHLRRSDEVNELYRKFAEEDKAQTQEDYRELLQLPAFRRVFAGILKRARVFGSISYDSIDTNYILKTVGMREMGVDIFAIANNADGELVLKAISERNEVEKSRARKIEDIIELEKKGKTPWKNL